MSTLEKAIAIAASAHAGVIDKAGAPYILHPLRVMMAVTSDDERIVAVLHDVVEDTQWTFERLRGEGFSEVVIEALESVTKRAEDEDEPGDDSAAKLARYKRFVSRAALNPIGRVVKIADLQDNMDLSRIDSPTEKDAARTEKYRKAVEFMHSTGTRSV